MQAPELGDDLDALEAVFDELEEGAPSAEVVDVSNRLIVPSTRPNMRSQLPSQSMSLRLGMFCRSANTGSPSTSRAESPTATKAAAAGVPSFLRYCT